MNSSMKGGFIHVWLRWLWRLGVTDMVVVDFGGGFALIIVLFILLIIIGAVCWC